MPSQQEMPSGRRRSNYWSSGLILAALLFGIFGLFFEVTGAPDHWAALVKSLRGTAVLLALAAFAVWLVGRGRNSFWSLLLVSPLLKYLVPREIREDDEE